MSTQEEEEHKEYIKRDSVVGGDPPEAMDSTSRDQQAVSQSHPVQRKEVVEKRTSTNTGAVVAIAIGIIVLTVGIITIYSQIPFVPWPYSMIVVLGLGAVLLAIGASMISSRTRTAPA